MVDGKGHFAHNRQAGMLQQIVHVVYGTGAGIFNRYDGIVGLAGFHLIKNIGKFGAATFNELLKVTGSVLTSGKM